MKDDVPQNPEVEKHLKLIDAYGVDAAKAYLSGRNPEAATTNRILLNMHSDMVGVLLS